MIITCPTCKARLRLPDEMVKSTGTRCKCAKCGMVLVYKETREEGEPPSPRETDDASTLKKADKEASGAKSEEAPRGPSPEDHARAKEAYRGRGLLAEERELIADKPFLEHLPDVIAYPFKAGGMIMLAAGAVFITAVLFFSRYAFLFGIIGYVFVGGYLSAFMMKIVSHTADGEIDLPDWPDFSDWWDDIIGPMFQMIMVAVVSYLPLIAYGIYGAVSRDVSPVPAIALLVLGALYQPMAVISMSIHRSIRALNPAHLFPAMMRIPLDYLIACGMLLFLFFVKWLFRIVPIPFIGPFIDNFIMLYLLVAEMRILGLIYYANREKFGWF